MFFGVFKKIYSQNIFFGSLTRLLVRLSCTHADALALCRPNGTDVEESQKTDMQIWSRIRPRGQGGAGADKLLF